MNPHRPRPSAFGAIIGFVIFAASAAPAQDPRGVRIDAVVGLKFSPSRFGAAPGESLALRFENADPTDLPHNLVLGKPGSLKKLVADALALGADGPPRGFVPDVPEVLQSTDLLNSGQSEILKFIAPAEPGIYPYLCTFPGHGYVMFGALYVDTEMPPESEDPNIPNLLPAGAPPSEGELVRPAIRRIFMRNAGPAAIAVALPGGQNYCFDAGTCSLRYAWSGDFLDAEKHFTGTGSARAKVLGKIYWRAPGPDSPLTFPDQHESGSTPRFLGYRLIAGRPSFEYEIGGVTVTEHIEEIPGNDGLLRHFEIKKSPGSLSIRLTSERGLLHPPAGTGAESDTARVQLSPGAAKNFSLRVTPK